MKWYGEIGYGITEETRPGVWVPATYERLYYGEITQNRRTLQSANQANDDINFSQVVSIVADPYATDHFHEIRYVKYRGTKWKVTNIKVQYPRLILTLGGVYNVQSDR